MLHPKATLAGLGAAVVSGVAATIVERFVMRRVTASKNAHIGAVSADLAWFGPAALLGFVAGFFINRRRTGRSVIG